MKFGKQLKLAIYPPWSSYYVPYGRLKRMIARLEHARKPFKNRDGTGNSRGILSGGNSAAASRDNSFVSLSFSPPVPESQPLKSGVPGQAVAKVYGEIEEDVQVAIFFGEVDRSIEMVNSFFRGKEAELTGMVRELERACEHPYSMESKGDFQHFRRVYIEIDALQRYVELNKEGFRKIVKKFDKAMGSDHQKAFVDRLSAQHFCTSTWAETAMSRIQELISRDKLLKLKQSLEEEASGAIFSHVRLVPMMVSLFVFVCVWYSRILHHDRSAHRCLAVLAFTITMWSTEAIPYFATSLFIPVLLVVLKVFPDPTVHEMPLAAPEAANLCLSSLVNHTTILILGGYAVSAAFSRCEIELQIASFLQKHLGHQPKLFMLAMMILGLLLSAVISNHTSPVLCLSIIAPIIRDFDNESPYTKALLLGIAYACNFGGMITPISSMQDALAVAYLQNAHVEVSFGRWIAVATPLCLLMTVVCWIFLLALYRPTDVTEIPIIVHSKETLTRKDSVVLALSLVTILMWSTLELTKSLLGDLGIVSLIFLTIVFGSGLLTMVDFNSFNWHTLFLLGGGNVLGKAIASSKLLDYIVNMMFAALPEGNPPLMLAMILGFTTFISTFVSHTVAALILMPLLVEIGLQVGDAAGIAVPAAFAVSAAMALPFSSFPNVIILSCTDDLESPYLRVRDFVVSGLPMSIIAVVAIGTIGYGLVQTLF